MGKVIDVHGHLVTPSYTKLVLHAAQQDADFRRLAIRNRLLPEAGPPQANPGLVDVAARVEQMDGAGVDIAAISLPPPGTGVLGGGTAATSRVNDELLAIAQESSGRLRVMLDLPLPDGGASLAELERVGGDPLVCGVQLMAVSQAYVLDDIRLRGVLHRISELGLVVLIHPALEDWGTAFHEFGLVGAYAPVLTSSLATLRLVLSGALDDVSDLDVIVPHLGGVIPFLLQRVEDLAQSNAAHPLEHYLRTRLYLDTVSFHPPAMRCAIESGGIGRIVLGSDAPFRGTLERAVHDIVDSRLSVDARAAILGGTAERWFR